MREESVMVHRGEEERESMMSKRRGES